MRYISLNYIGLYISSVSDFGWIETGKSTMSNLSIFNLTCKETIPVEFCLLDSLTLDNGWFSVWESHSLHGLHITSRFKGSSTPFPYLFHKLQLVLKQVFMKSVSPFIQKIFCLLSNVMLCGFHMNSFEMYIFQAVS